MSSRFTHSVCARCYAELHPGRTPVALREEHRTAERCCRCGEPTTAGIYVRAEPSEMLCGGNHD